MRCLDCDDVIRSPSGKTKETQRCGKCRGVPNKINAKSQGRLST